MGGRPPSRGELAVFSTRNAELDLFRDENCKKVVALAADELPGCFPSLVGQLFLLIPNPAELGDRVSSGHFQTSRFRGRQGDPALWRVNGKMDILDVLARHGDGNVTELDCFGHQ